MNMKASALLTDETKWCQGSLAVNVGGISVSPYEVGAVKWCITGAAMRCQYTPKETEEFLTKLYKIVISDKVQSVVAWQDTPTRTFSEVRELLLRIGH